MLFIIASTMCSCTIADISRFNIISKLCITHVSTRVLIPLAIFLVVIFTVTTTKELVNDITRLHRHIGGRDRGSITTAIYLPDAGRTATFDNHLSLFLITGRLVGCQVTTAIDGRYIIDIRIIQTIHRIVDSLCGIGNSGLVSISQIFFFCWRQTGQESVGISDNSIIASKSSFLCSLCYQSGQPNLIAFILSLICWIGRRKGNFSWNITLTSSLRRIDMYQSMPLRCTVQVVTSEHLINDTAFGIVSHILVQLYRGIT